MWCKLLHQQTAVWLGSYLHDCKQAINGNWKFKKSIKLKQIIVVLLQKNDSSTEQTTGNVFFLGLV